MQKFLDNRELFIKTLYLAWARTFIYNVYCGSQIVVNTGTKQFVKKLQFRRTKPGCML